jgi:hypothetical protein
VARGSAAAIRSWRSERDRAGAESAVRARRREGVGRVDSAEEVVAKRSKAARMDASVEAVMRCCFAREEGSFGAGAGGARKREEEDDAGGGARGRRLGGYFGRMRMELVVWRRRGGFRTFGWGKGERFAEKSGRGIKPFG